MKIPASAKLKMADASTVDLWAPILLLVFPPTLKYFIMNRKNCSRIFLLCLLSFIVCVSTYVSTQKYREVKELFGDAIETESPNSKEALQSEPSEITNPNLIEGPPLEPYAKESINLFDMHKVQDFQSNPLLCATFVSCKRTDLLKRTIKAFIEYMQRVEPDIAYEIVVWDNGSGKDAVSSLLQEFPIDRFVSSRVNTGLSTPFNAMFFELCRSPYIISLEEDWEARQSWPVHFPAIQMGMKVLESNDKLLDVHLKFGDNYPFIDSEWMLTEPNSNMSQFLAEGRVQYHLQSPGKGEGGHWASFQNGATLKHRNRLKLIGRFKNNIGEADYARRAAAMNFSNAHLCWETSASVEKNNRCDQGDPEPKTETLFVHIGTNGRSPGQADFAFED